MASKVHSTSARQAIVPRQRILLCYDGSAEARRALERVGEIASVVLSWATVVSVADPVYPDPPYSGYADPGARGGRRWHRDDPGAHGAIDPRHWPAKLARTEEGTQWLCALKTTL